MYDWCKRLPCTAVVFHRNSYVHDRLRSGLVDLGDDDDKINVEFDDRTVLSLLSILKRLLSLLDDSGKGTIVPTI